MPTRTRVAFGNDGGELRRIHEPSGVAKDAVDRAQFLHLRHVRKREAPERLRVRRAGEEQRVARLAVATSATDHLHVLLERAGVVDEADQSYVRLVDSHAEGGRRDDGLRTAREERVLDARPLVALEPGVVVLGAQAVPA